MESIWTKAEFQGFARLEGAPADLIRRANENLARELSGNLSAFLQTSIAATYTSGKEIQYKDCALQPECCYALALVRPGQRKMLLKLDYSILFALVGIALGAKAGSFATPGRAPTEIELQVVMLLFRRILTETYRAWIPLTKTPLETVTVEFELTAARVYQATEAVFAGTFDLTCGGQTGQLALILPPDVFVEATREQEAPIAEPVEPTASVESTLEAMMAGKVAVQVWLEGAQAHLGDLLQLTEGQVLKLDHPVERKACCTFNGASHFTGQIVSTGSRRAFLVEDSIP